ncbi:hypothetical protein ACFLXQ_02280 [Chloroflexota bacterium]
MGKRRRCYPGDNYGGIACPSKVKIVSKRKLNKIGIQAARLLLAFLCGILVGIQLPSLLLRAGILPPFGNPTVEIDPFLLETDVNSLILIDNEADVLFKRNELIEFIWGKEGFPDTELPDKIEADIVDVRYKDLDNLKQINKVTIIMAWQINSVAYHFVPEQGNQRLVVYHQGHYGDFIFGKEAIQRFLSRGYAVIALSMPLYGLNNRPVVDLPRTGKLKIADHDHLKFLQMENGHPVKFFLQPVAVVLNYAQQYDYTATTMMGLSGGGWTTTLYAAIDTRILRSYPVAGTLPIYLRPGYGLDWGDYEQTIPELYTIANYLELYILGSYGEGRKQLQILSKYDPCCYAGIRYRTYEDVVKERVQSLGAGHFEVYLDESNREHKISTRALEVILDDINSNG